MKYVHTNLISKDWKTLAGFYIQVFECKLILPQRDLEGDWLSKGTGVKNAKLKGAHLRLPGYGKKGPSLEIFEYAKMEDQATPIANRKGFGHIAFEVENVQEVLDKAIKFGGKAYGQVVSKDIEGLGTLTFVYIKDPEGNIIEIQNWGPSSIRPTKTEERHKDDAKKDKTVVLPSDKNEVVQVKGKEDETVKEESLVHKKDKDAKKTKRELLDELRKDLEASKRDIQAAKDEIKTSKEKAKLNGNKKPKTLEEFNKKKELSIDETNLSKTKAELLEELKKEMNISDKKIQIGPEKKSKKTGTEEQETKKSDVVLKLPTVASKLTVEIKTATGTKELKLKGISLSKPANSIAKDLRSLTVLARPDDYEFLFIEWVGKIYKADIVPLKKQFSSTNSKEQNDNAWALLARMKGSLEHLLGRCESDPEMLFDLKLKSIGMSSADFVAAFKNLQIIVAEAEKQNASHIRLHYSAE